MLAFSALPAEKTYVLHAIALVLLLLALHEQDSPASCSDQVYSLGGGCWRLTTDF